MPEGVTVRMEGDGTRVLAIFSMFLTGGSIPTLSRW